MEIILPRSVQVQSNIGCPTLATMVCGLRGALRAFAIAAVATAQLVEYQDLADVTHKLIVHNTGSDDLGFYYLGGGYDDTKKVGMWDGSETLNARFARAR